MMEKTIFVILLVVVVGCKCDISKESVTITIDKNEYETTLNIKLVNYLYPKLVWENLGVDEINRIDEETWHWMPYKKLQILLDDDPDCIEVSQSEDFPDSIFTLEQLRQGAVILYFIGTIYFFTLLTVICNDYFLPTVECICIDLNLSKDVAAATFMATATTTPEFFTNTISTFIMESDLGLGTIIGSLMFNTLGVAALAGLAAPKPVQLDWWPISRDCVIYSINLSVLIAFAWDGLIYWYEAMVFVILFFVYFVIMFQNTRIMKLCKSLIEVKLGCCKKNNFDMDQVAVIKAQQIVDDENNNDKNIPKQDGETKTGTSLNDEDKPTSLWKIPRDTKFSTFWFFYVWPIKFLLTFTIPNPQTYRKLYPISFIMCILYIGGNSFLIVWMIVRIGETFAIPDSVMGLTFLAAGGCLPEAISAVIMARKGEGGMGVSNSLGANSLAILFSLGLPWFIKTLVDGGSYESAYINIHSYGMEFVILSLLLTVVGLYLVISLAGYRLKKLVGCLLLAIYLVFITMAILVELDVFFPSGNTC